MDKKPYVELHCQNFLDSTRTLSLSAKAIGFELFYFICDNERSLPLTGTSEEFSRLLRCTTSEFLTGLQELKKNNIFAVSLGDGDPDFYSTSNIISISITTQNKANGW